ncbi:YsnF/AvaK domain-containing protein [Massilia sp. H6]|uniref:YsnF/AvaK domain-containing protein n=1 Tax=Massilia sp. H6 TaxID=2970464 RepID=UPI00216752D5|nr:YsnF/AvaK domain-containing protein [Massilia sp. H6]UVW27142.1 DUF2382 domain-containing protein [Massilia sp. H6]
MQHTLVAVFDNRTDAQNAMNELLSSGFSREEVRLSGSDTGSASTTASDTDTDSGFGSGIKNFFSDLFSDSDEHVDRYQGALSSGKNVITLTADSLDEVERAADIIEGFGPVDIDEHASGTGAGVPGAMLSGSQSGMSSSSMSAQSGSSGQQGSLTGSSLQRDTSSHMGGAGSDAARSNATQSIPVVEEQLKVGKREVQRGGVRIFSRVVETPVNETIGLREEHVDVQRRQVDQPLDPLDSTAFKEQTIEMRETSEEAVVEKSARIVEEVTIGKQVNERQEQISDSVRHTEVDVEQLGTTGTQDRDSEYRSHFQSHYGSTGDRYDDYAPAYGYGSQMRSDTRYKNRGWAEAENDLRTDWESRNSGKAGSTWDRMKAAVRHGWDRMTDDDDSSKRSY